MDQPVSASLHITIQQAGDPEKLGELFKAALAAQDRPAQEAKEVVPTGYRCVECYRADGGHDNNCSIASDVVKIRG